ncbi:MULTISPECIES: hypothetical protein [unclassified Streptomyces]
MNAEKTLRQLDAMFKTSARTVKPTAVDRHRKPQGQGDQRTCED